MTNKITEPKKDAHVIYKRKKQFFQWVDFQQEEPEKDGVVVLYIPDAYSEKYFLMNLSTPCHEGWYERNKKNAKAWFRIPKYSKQDVIGVLSVGQLEEVV